MIPRLLALAIVAAFALGGQAAAWAGEWPTDAVVADAAFAPADAPLAEHVDSEEGVPTPRRTWMTDGTAGRAARSRPQWSFTGDLPLRPPER